MIDIFSVFKVIEPQGNFMDEPYDSGEYKLTWMLVVTFSTLQVYFIYIKYTYFATFMKYILKLL
jgi:hypothetical protein